jgi:hypothetical protein
MKQMKLGIGMRRGRRRAQVILTVAIAIVLVILTAAMLVYLTATQHLAFPQNPSRDIILGIDSDFGRALERILAQATTIYNATAEINTPRIRANQLFTYWVMSTQAAYAKSGLNIGTNLTSSLLQQGKSLYGYAYSARWLYNLTKLYWYYPQSISAIGASISINSAQGGYVGWESSHVVLLNLTLHVPSIRRGSGNNLLFDATILREDNQPITDLSPKNVAVYLYDPTAGVGAYCWKRANVTQLTYNGGGNYTCWTVPQFSQPGQSSSFWSFYYKFILVIVQDNRGIIVESYSYASVEYTIAENAIEPFFPSNSLKNWETYVFDLLPNGTMYWYNKKLSYSALAPPIPLPPVKQFRVMATRLGVADPNYVEVPYQAEVWSNDYLWPSPNFAEWRKRFTNGSKLVFEVNYPPGVGVQKVRITWLDDGDTSPPVYRISITQSGAFADINNGVYTLRLYAKPGYSTWVDYSISLIGFGYHTEYTLLGFDVHQMSGGWWFPDKLPGGNWTILTGPIRCVAFRNSSVIMEPPTGKNYYDEMNHQMIIYIPYNVTYFLYSMKATWLNPVHMNYAYMTPFGMISGASNDSSLPGRNLRVRWGSLLASNGRTVNGTFSNSSNIMHRDRNYNNAQNYSYWASMYRAGYASSMVASEDLMKELRSYTIGGTQMDQLWVWTTADYQRRVMEYDSIYWKTSSTPSYNTNPSQKITFKAAGFLSSGGTATSPFIDDNIWRRGSDSNAAPRKASTGVAEPSIYYRMFLDAYAPSISAIVYA